MNDPHEDHTRFGVATAGMTGLEIVAAMGSGDLPMPPMAHVLPFEPQA